MGMRLYYMSSYQLQALIMGMKIFDQVVLLLCFFIASALFPRI
jgi:hypothetical protein